MDINKRKEILAKFHNQFCRYEWYRDCAIIENHPINMETTLEIKVNYRPAFNMEEVLSFGRLVSLPLYFNVVG